MLLKKQPSLRTMQMFTEKTQQRVNALKEPYPFCSISWSCSAYSQTSVKIIFTVNWCLDNRILSYDKWSDLTGYIETMLEKREDARRRGR